MKFSIEVLESRTAPALSACPDECYDINEVSVNGMCLVRELTGGVEINPV